MSEGGAGARNHGAQVATDADGDRVVVWESVNEPTISVMARLYGADGAPRGEPFRVSPEGQPAVRGDVAMDAAGNFVVAYVAIGEAPAEGRPRRAHVRVARFAADGTPRGDPVDVDPNAFPGVGNAGEIGTAMSGDGKFLVAWRDTGFNDGPSSGQDIVARFFNAGGVPVGETFRVHSSAQYVPRLGVDAAMDADGDAVITWHGYATPGDDALPANVKPGTATIYARCFDSAGTAVGPERIVNTPEDGPAGSYPSAAMDADGDFVVSWQSGNDSTQTRVLARTFAAAGDARGPAVTVAAYDGTRFQLPGPDVDMDATGKFLVAWRAQQKDEIVRDAHWVYARHYDAEGRPLNDAVLVSQSTRGGFPVPSSVALSDAGDRAVVTWMRDDGAGAAPGVPPGLPDQKIYARLLVEREGTDGEVANLPPTVLATPQVKVGREAEEVVLNLADLFADDHDPLAGLAFQVDRVPLPGAVVQTALDPAAGTLTLQFPGGVDAHSTLTITVTDSGGLKTMARIPLTVGDPPPPPPPEPAAGHVLRGRLFQDVDGDGRRDRGEAGLSGFQVFCDRDGDGVRDPEEPITVTRGDGAYEFPAVAPGSGEVRVILPPGWRPGALAGDRRQFTISGRRRAPVNVAALSVAPAGQISGAAFLDANGNGVRDASERAFRRARVFLDLNGDGVWQKKTERAVTADRAGNYTFSGLTGGSYKIGVARRRHVLTTLQPGGAGVTVPDGTPVTDVVLGVARVGAPSSPR